MISSDTPIRSCVFSPGVAGTPLRSWQPGTLWAPRPHPKPGLTQQPPEGDGRRQGRKVDEDDGSQDLGAECVCEVTQVVGVAAPYVTH